MSSPLLPASQRGCAGTQEAGHSLSGAQIMQPLALEGWGRKYHRLPEKVRAFCRAGGRGEVVPELLARRDGADPSTGVTQLSRRPRPQRGGCPRSPFPGRPAWGSPGEGKRMRVQIPEEKAGSGHSDPLSPPCTRAPGRPWRSPSAGGTAAWKPRRRRTAPAGGLPARVGPASRARPRFRGCHTRPP